MIGYVGKIEELTLQNDYFRHVIYTAPHSQLVLMCLNPSEEIGVETHQNVDQFFRIEQGEGKVVLNGEDHTVSDGFAIVVPAGIEHNVINTSSDKKLKLYTIYSPANHKDGTIHKTKAEAMADEEDKV
ncbi:MAG: cupin domain-containing protein [Patescibacteria group bacterium]|nr:cupin domain-containing protein [Patescibacteria group bacterium]